MLQDFFKRHWRTVWNGPFYIGPLVQPISVGSAFIKVLEVAWRTAIIGAVAISTIAIGTACWSLLSPAFAPPPQDQEECKAAAAIQADSAAAEADCVRRFPAERHDGGYAIYVPDVNEWVQVSGPRPTQADYEMIQELKEKEIKLKRRQDQAINNLMIRSYNISCNIDDRYIACYDKNITVNLYNGSDMTISGLHFSYEIGRGLDCSGSLGKTFVQPMSIPPHKTGSFVHNVKFDSAGPNGVMTGCLRLDGVEQIE